MKIFFGILKGEVMARKSLWECFLARILLCFCMLDLLPGAATAKLASEGGGASDSGCGRAGN